MSCKSLLLNRNIGPWVWAFLLFLCSSEVLALTATATPSTCISATSGGTKTWSNATRAVSSNNSYATASVDGTTTRYLQCTGYGFALPLGVVVTGITVNVERKSSKTDNGGSRDAYVRLVKGGVIGTTDRATSTVYTNSDVTEAHGGSSDLWGQTWTAADINASNFGAAFAATKPSSAGKSHTISVDVISITVTYTADTTPPTVTAIALASYNPVSGSTVDWTVTFSESVTGVDSTDFSLVTTGVSGASIASVTGSGSTWTVTANTGSGSGTIRLDLVDNDSIVDILNKLGGTGAGNGNFTGQTYTIDKTNPLVLSINRSGTSPTNVASVSWSVVFTKAVTGVDATDFVLVSTGTVSGANISSVTGSGTNWTVTATGLTGTGTLGLNLVDNDSIIDVALNKLAGTGLTGLANGSRTGQVYTVDRDAPTVASITRDDANPSNLNEVSWTVTFSEAVTGVDTTDFVLVTSGLAGPFITGVSGSGTTWTVTADPGYGVGTIGLNLVDDDTIVDIVLNKLGGTGAGNGNFTGEVYTVTTPPLSSYRMEQASWNGTTDEVIDEQGANPGTAKNSATTANTTQALTGDPGTCRSGLFANASGPTISKGYVDLTVDFPYQVDSFTITGWIRTTNNATSKQWIFTHNTGGLGYALSLGEAGTGRLRFSSGGASTVNLDSPSGASSLLANNTWYFVAAVADFSSGTSVTRSLYAYTTAGALVSGFPVSLTTTGWDTTETGAASIGGDGTTSFQGSLDEIQVFDKALNQSAVAAVAQARHACTTAVPDHYELSIPSSSVSCLATTVTVTACADTSSPCNSAFTGANGATANLTASGGSLALGSVVFNASGVATTTLSYPAASNGTAVSVTLSGESISATNNRTCCANGSSCSVANSCSSTFNTAGFLVTNAAGGSAYTIPTQTAGTSSTGNLFLRAVKTNTTTQACESALVGTTNVNWGVQCNNPTTCSSGSLMSLQGTTSTAANSNPIASNANGSNASSTSVSMTFDANGNAPFSFNYEDVGQVTLFASKTAGGSLLSALSGSSNSFVVKPAGFTVTNITQTAPPYSTNPAATSAGGAKFINAGESFTATVTATSSTGATTPNFGRETTPEGVVLTHALVLPNPGATGSFSNGTIGGASFSNGVATVTNLAWSEVGIITLTPSVSDSSYLGTGNVTGSNTGANSGNIGRFTPAYFDTVVTTAGCGAFTYSGQAMQRVDVTAKATGGTTTVNYAGATWARQVTLSDANGGTGTWAGNTIAATGFSNGIGSSSTAAYTFASKATVPTTIKPRATETSGSDAVSSSGGTEGTASIRSGRVRLRNAYGSERLTSGLPVPVAIEYYDAPTVATAGWRTGTDTCTVLSPSQFSYVFSGSGFTACRTAGAAMDTNPTPTLTLAQPNGFATGYVDLTLNLGAIATGSTCTSPTNAGTGFTGGVITANAPWLQFDWKGTGATNPTARATFGVYKSPLIYRRENY